jgi:UDP-N-acetylglucosamine 2-epimerase (non-hydrolysing)
MRKVMTIVGTRPELIKMACVIQELDRHTQHVLVHTGQNYDYELNQVFFDDLEIRKPDHFMNAVGRTAMETIGNVLVKTDELLELEQPRALLVYGDTNSCLSVIAAKRRKIPVFHMEAGNRCFDDRVPEEINRRIIDHISDINMTLTEHARRYLIAEGIRPETVIKTGSSMKEVLHRYRHKIEASQILDKLQLSPQNYFLVSAHREENVDSPRNFELFLETLNALAKSYSRKVLVSTHPRTRKRLENLPSVTLNPLVELSKPFGFCDYIALQQNAACVISDSGTITEESSILGFPAITIRDAHERPEGMDEGTLIMCGMNPENVLDAIRIVVSQTEARKSGFRTVPDYDVENVSQKVVRIISSYIDYINHTVWSR